MRSPPRGLPRRGHDPESRASEPEAYARSRLVALALRERQARDDQLLTSGKLNDRDLMLFGHVDMAKDVKVDLLQGLDR